MKYCIYKLKFTTPVHIGKKLLTDANETIPADTLFSALCLEALKYGGEAMINELVDYVKNNQLVFTDALPYKADTYYVPKPLNPVKKVDKKGDSKRKKAFKKIKYIPLESIDEFIEGDFEPENETVEFGKYALNAKVAVSRFSEEDAEPYYVGTYTFNEDSGLYICMGYENDMVKDQVTDLLNMLASTGVGGKVSSGLGKYELYKKNLPAKLSERLEKDYSTYMTLSVSLPMEDELEEALKGAHYVVEKRSGFVMSSTYSDEFVRKNDIYVMTAGSCFNMRFNGDVYDVSAEGRHAVYRYAKPFMIGVD